MIKLFVVIISFVIAVRTLLYGVWTIKQRNMSGGIMLMVLSVVSFSLSAYFMLKN